MSIDGSFPERLGVYRLKSSLGRGGMGEVFLAWDERLERHVALKRILPEPPPSKPARERFRREARAAARLSHPAIVQVFDLLETDHGDCLVMEHVEGYDLTELIAVGELDLDTTLRLATEIADGLAEAHACGLVHRDLKPENVRVTRSGRRAKILDFGLARLLWTEELTGESRTETLTRAASLTEAGALMGTVHAMSPEQASGRPVDHRSDLFAIGGLLYEMLTGRSPFHGDNLLDTLRRITSEEPTPLAELRQDLPPALVELIGKLLAKAPEDRPANARVVAEALELMRAERLSGQAVPAPALATPAPAGADISDLPTGQWPAPPDSATSSTTGPRPLRQYATAALLGVLICAGVLWWSARPNEEPARQDPLAGSGSAKPTMAVLHFQNLTDDTELDWLQSGITEMLITDLSQSPEIEVLSSSRLHRISAELGTPERAASPFELIQAMAASSGVATVVRGGYARLGDRLRISFTLEEAASGRILQSDNVDGRGQESLFAMVDELSAAIRNSFEVAAKPELPATVQAVTTSSLEAWRLYSEASSLISQSKRSEAIVLLEKAVDLDPDFALALVNLGSLHGDLGHGTEARKYTRRAVDLADRLPLDHRFQVQGVYYSDRWTTYDRAIEAFRETLRLYPDRTAARDRLARLYAHREHYQQATEEFRKLIDGGTTHPGTYLAAANIHAALGNFETGYRLLSDFAQDHPENWLTQIGLGWHLTDWGKLDDASGFFRRAQELRPGEIAWHNGRWRLGVLQEDWQMADLDADALLSLDDPFARWRGAVSRARNLLYRGRSEEALDAFDLAIGAYPEPEGFTALAYLWKAELLLQKDEAGLALAAAERGQELAPGEWPELHGLFLVALAQQALGRPQEASRCRRILEQRASANPNPVQERQLHHLDGLLSLAAGDSKAALESLSRAEAMLPPHGIEFHWFIYPQHVPIWYALGRAALADGDPAAARGWFERVADSGAEHLEEPVPFVRSLFLLAQTDQQQGELAAARRAFERFLVLWNDGDLDRQQVELSLAALGRP